MRNLESKLAVGELAEIRARALAAGAEPQGTLAQRDTFYGAGRARLKLREHDARAELIAYARPDEPGSRWSSYELVPVEDARALDRALTLALGVEGTVVKQRELLLLDHTRVHLDQVEELGCFVELETVCDGIDDAQAAAEHARVLGRLGLDRLEPVAGAYLDLLAERGS